ncbi:lycopene cyclase domain-containing protein [Mycetocola saprophilus]|uniref:lycopene cyclase domain-containing protein n=1 Tax=Mycetocola saprophilus TaxID=76636 RepID=UPI003BF35731
MTGGYALALLISIGGLALIDLRHKLFFWDSPIRAALTLTTGLVAFIAWDLWAIHAGIFFRGDSPLLLHWNLAPEFPVEEILFLTLLCYSAMILYTLGARLLTRIRTRRSAAS